MNKPDLKHFYFRVTLTLVGGINAVVFFRLEAYDKTQAEKLLREELGNCIACGSGEVRSVDRNGNPEGPTYLLEHVLYYDVEFSGEIEEASN